MTKLISLSILALAISMANAVPTKRGNVVQYSDPDVVDAKNLGIDLSVLSDKDHEHKKSGHWGGHKSEPKSWGKGDVVQYSDPDVVDAKNAKVGVHILDGRNLPSYEQYSDPDVVDAKNLGLDVNVLSDKKHEHKKSGHWGGHKSEPKSWGKGDVVQYSDPDVVDAKNAKIGVDILKRHGHEGGVYQYSDPDVIDLKNLDLGVHILDGRNLPTYEQYSDPDVVDAKNLKLGVDILKRNEGKVVQYSDPDVVDAKNAKVGIHILDGRNLPTYEQYSDPDVVDAKNLKVGVDILKRNEGKKVVQYSDPDVVDIKNLKALIDILRRNDYEVIKRSAITKRSDSDMWQYEEENHTCYCSKKPGNHAPVSKPTSTPTHTPGNHTPVHKPTSTPTHKHHHTSEPAKSTSTPTHKHHHHTSEPAKSTSTSTHEHHHHHHEPTSTSSADKGKPTQTPKSCPSGYKHANGGSIIQYSDPDLIDLKNLKIDISILSNNGSEEKKTVPAKSPPKCSGDYCCYKWNEESVKQISDPDLIDAKNAGINISLLSNNGGKSGLVSGLLGGLGL